MDVLNMKQKEQKKEINKSALKLKSFTQQKDNRIRVKRCTEFQLPFVMIYFLNKIFEIYMKNYYNDNMENWMVSTQVLVPLVTDFFSLFLI